MKLPAFCIDRPVFATVLSLILVVIGVMGYQNLQTRFFPRFEQNQISITTTYAGASANLIESSVTTPLEKAISGIEGIDDITSVSDQGVSTITVDVKSGINTFDITNKIRNQVAMTTSQLPSTIQAPIVQMGHASMDLMDIGFSVQGDQLNNLRDYLDVNVIPRLQQLSGISEVDALGANKYAMRITLHPNDMTARHVSIDAVEQAITDSNLELPAGYIESPTMDFPITAKTALHSANAFGNIVVKDDKGQLIYLKDIATVKLGNDTATQSLVRINNNPAILLSIYNSTAANPINASKRVRTLLENIKQQLPSSIHATITFDQSNFMKNSIAEVYKSIALAILFVGIIIYLFLGKLRSAFIPIITIPICVLATMGMMYFMGFSINIITLLAIVLSIGLVVDDAIVVLENIHRHIEAGLTRVQAALKGSQEIATPVIAMTLTLAAVYAPIGLIKGIVAHIFASFAFTLAAAVIISGFVALTLSPMMCSLFIDSNHTEKSTFQHTIETLFNRLTVFYKKILHHVLLHRIKIIIITMVFVIGGFMLASSLPKTFLPNEDMGFLITSLNSPAGTNNNYSGTQLETLSHMLIQNKNIENAVSLSMDHSSDGNGDMIFSTLKNYNHRTESASKIGDTMNAETKKIPGLNAISFAPSFGGDIHSSIAFYIMAPASYQYLYSVGKDIASTLNQYPGLINAQSNIQFDNQQYDLTVNRQLADQMQVSVRSIDNTLAAFLGGSTVSTFNVNGQSYDVDLQADKPYLQNIDMMTQMTVPTTSGTLIPLGNLISVKAVPMQTDLFHYNQLRAAQITAEVAPGYSMGAVVAYLQKSLPTLLPSNVKYSFTGQAERIVKSSNTMLSIFLMSFVFIYLVLSAQFESFIDPLIILLAVPLSMVGALISLKCINGSINMYTIIGLVTLVGLIAKHGILITQFANELQRSGQQAIEALINAAGIRLRPILMTTAAMIFGALPLVFASGASAISREQVGVVFVGGLLMGTFFSLILVPISYSYFAQLKKWIATKKLIIHQEN